jgi:hypothetical protein
MECHPANPAGNHSLFICNFEIFFRTGKREVALLLDMEMGACALPIRKSYSIENQSVNLQVSTFP